MNSTVVGDNTISRDNSAKVDSDIGQPATRSFGFEPVWQWMVRHPILSALLILALQTIPTLWSRDLRPVDELRHAAVFLEIMDHGNWLALHMNGWFYADKPPVYFWLLALLAWIFQTKHQTIIFLGTAISAGLLVVATYQMARIVSRGSRQFGLIAALVLLTNVFFIERTHYPRMDLLFSTFICLSITAFFAALENSRAWQWTFAGFAFATLAALTKGPFGFVSPILTVVVFLLATRNLSRLFSADMLAGFVFSVCVILLYFLGLYWAEGEAYLTTMFGYVDHKAGWSREFSFNLDQYLYFLISRWLPWTLLIFFIPWRKIFRSMAALSPAYLYLAISVCSILLPLSLISYTSPNFLVIVLPPLAVLSSALLVSLSSKSLRVFITFIASILFLLGIAFPIVAVLNTGFFIVPYGFSSGIVAVAAAFYFFRIRARGFPPFLMVLTGITTLITLLHFSITLPENEKFKSIRPASAVISEYIDKGYEPLSLGYTHFGVFFQYFSGHRIREFEDWDSLTRELQTGERSVVVTTKRAFDLWPDRPVIAEIVYHGPQNPSLPKHNDWMDKELYVFLVEPQ